MSKTRAAVVIVGGGPVGLLTALRLGQAGVDTLVLEAHDSILPATRAVVYMPVVIPVLKNLGILEAVKQEAFLNRQGITWRDIEGQPLANLPLTDDTSGEFGGVLLLGQYKLAMIILEELKKYPCVQVCFGQRCVGIRDDPTAGPVTLMTVSRSIDQPEFFVEADYVLATDGANSAVRRLLCIAFEGFTYRDWRMIGTDVLYDFVEEQNFTPLNFVVHPEHWAVIAYTGQDDQGNRHGSGGRPQYRVAYAEKPDLPDAPEDYLRRARERLPCWIKGGKPFELLRAEPYINSQRVAREASKGRVFLGGDALSANNPIGGLGLTSGIADAYCYGNALVRVVQGKEPASLLKECADARRQTWIDVTDPLSQANINRLYATDAESVAARDGFFGKLNTDSAFPALVRSGMGKLLVDTFEL